MLYRLYICFSFISWIEWKRNDCQNCCFLQVSFKLYKISSIDLDAKVNNQLAILCIVGLSSHYTAYFLFIKENNNGEQSGTTKSRVGMHVHHTCNVTETSPSTARWTTKPMEKTKKKRHPPHPSPRHLTSPHVISSSVKYVKLPEKCYISHNVLKVAVVGDMTTCHSNFFRTMSLFGISLSALIQKHPTRSSRIHNISAAASDPVYSSRRTALI